MHEVALDLLILLCGIWVVAVEREEQIAMDIPTGLESDSPTLRQGRNLRRPYPLGQSYTRLQTKIPLT